MVPVHKTILRDCRRIAKNKLSALILNKHNFYHFSFIVQNGCIIEWGTNVNHEPQKYFSYHSRITKGRPGLHSEINAYKKARGLLQSGQTFNMINIRLSKRGGMRMSKPCRICHIILEAIGCKYCYYSTNLSNS